MHSRVSEDNNQDCQISYEKLDKTDQSQQAISDFSQDATVAKALDFLQDVSVLDKMNAHEKVDQNHISILRDHLSRQNQLSNVSVADMVSLLSDSEVSEGIMINISSFFNQPSSDWMCIYFNHVVDTDHITQRFQKSSIAVNRLVMYLNVYKDQKGETHLSSSVGEENNLINKSHYTLAVLDFLSHTLTYADTCGWKIPKLFVEKLDALLMALHITEKYTTFYCHSPSNTDRHVCNPLCSKLYPVQTCCSVSGIAVILGMTLACLQYDVFISVAQGVDCQENVYLRYLQNISTHSKFLRLIIGCWIASSTLHLYHMFCDSSIEAKTLISHHHQSHSKNTDHIREGQVRNHPLCGPPSKNLDPIFPVLEKEEGSLLSSSTISCISNDSSTLEQLLSQKPVIQFCKPNHFRLKVKLKNGRCLYKMFKCSGVYDQAAKDDIEHFISSGKAVQWIQSKTTKQKHKSNATNSQLSDTRICVSTPVRVKSNSLLLKPSCTPRKKTTDFIKLPEGLESYVLGKPELSFEKKAQKLILRVFIKQSKSGKGRMFKKLFKCSSAGKEDKNAIANVTTFIASEEFRQRILEIVEDDQLIFENELSGNPSKLDDFVSRKPIIRFFKDKRYLKVECVLKSGKKIYKNFGCSSAGKNDKVAMERVHEFLNSGAAIDWINNKTKEMDSKNVNIDTSSIDDLIKKTYINFSKPNRLSLEIILRNNKKVSKRFPCSSLGKGDLNALNVIQEYLDSAEALEWIKCKVKPMNDNEVKTVVDDNSINNKLCNDESGWLPDGEVDVGVSTKHYFDNFSFDFRKRVTMVEGIRSINHGNDATMNISITQNEKWGKTHRLDEIYVYDPGSCNNSNEFPANRHDNNNATPAVTMYINCSSKSSACTADCGMLLEKISDSSKLRFCPGCETSVENVCKKECVACATETTPKWYTIGQEPYCNACYLYHCRHSRARPPDLKRRNVNKVPQKIYHPHFSCKWKMKLVLYINNLSTWKIFKGKGNSKAHQLRAVQAKKRPNLSTKDAWIEQRVIYRAKPKQILSATCGRDNVDVNNTEHVQDFKAETTIKQINNFLHSVDKYIKSQSKVTTVLESGIAKVENDMESTYESDILAVTEIESQDVIGSESILCSQCIANDIPSPFTCSNQMQLMKHIASAHQIKLLMCATCWVESESPVYFEDESHLKEHVRYTHTPQSISCTKNVDMDEGNEAAYILEMIEEQPEDVQVHVIEEIKPSLCEVNCQFESPVSGFKPKKIKQEIGQ